MLMPRCYGVMTGRAWQLSLLAYPVLLLLVSSVVLADANYPGWSRSSDNKKHAIVFRPVNAPQGADVFVKYYPAVLLEGLGADEWLLSKLSNSKAPKGNWNNEPVVTRQTANMASGSRSFKKSTGGTGRLEAFAFTADRQYVRLAVAIYTRNQANNTYLKQAWNILGAMSQAEKADALAQQRGHDIEKSPPKVQGIKTGIPIKAGRYVGVKTRGIKILDRYELILFDNGEYEFLKGGDSGRYVYSQATGRLNIEDDFYNSTYKPAEEFCIFGINEATGKHTVYAEEGAMSRYQYRLVWTNPVNRPSPTEHKKAKDLAKAEARRYKHVTNPGDGIKSDQIEAVLYTSDTGYSGTQLSLEESVYLLMKDGRVMDGIPVAPDMLDVAKSRSREPDRWGWWRYDGKQYRFAWNVDKKNYVLPRGTQTIARPIATGSKLEGTWSSSSSFASLDVSMTSFWGVHLGKTGRFKKYKHGLAQGGGEMQGLGPMVTIASDDEKSVASVIGSNIGGGTITQKNNPKSNRMGWYEFDDYNLTLKFDNGTIKRMPTFTLNDDNAIIWFEDASLRRKKATAGD